MIDPIRKRPSHEGRCPKCYTYVYKHGSERPLDVKWGGKR